MQNYANLVRLSEACDAMVGRTIRAHDLTIGNGSDQDVYSGEIDLVVTEFDRTCDTSVDQPSGVIDAYLWVECANATEAAKLPDGYRALWVYGPSIDRDGVWERPQFKIISPSSVVS